MSLTVSTEIASADDLRDLLWCGGRDNLDIITRLGKGDAFIQHLERAADCFDEGLSAEWINDYLRDNFAGILKAIGVLWLIDDRPFIRWLYEQTDELAQLTITLDGIREGFDTDMTADDVECEIDEFEWAHRSFDLRGVLDWDDEAQTLTVDFPSHTLLEW